MPPRLTVTQSEMRTFMECPHKWRLAYETRLSPHVDGFALTFGTAFHHGIHTMRSNGVPDYDGIQRIIDEHPRPDPSNRAAYSKCRAMVRAYDFLRDRNAKEHASELEFAYAFNRVNRLRGKIDLIAEKDDGSLWIVDYKTTTEQYTERVVPPLDIQACAYVWAGFKMHEAGALPRPPHGIRYEVIQKPTIRPKQVTATVFNTGYEIVGTKKDANDYLKTHRADGRPVEITTQETREETDEEYEARCLDWILEDLDGENPRYVTIERVFDAADLKTAEMQLRNLFAAIRRAQRGEYHVNTTHCRFCPFSRVCEWVNHFDDTETRDALIESAFLIRPERNPELAIEGEAA
ncbi:MAG: PD-(D/E)XK nuclease family protein [Candidatus Poribacteria bacterium]|nr:PD-(D/E)XK nuclease family protein [Candidatus Poribacteria bacterium]